MKIEKRNKKYRVRKTINGKSYSKTWDHAPTKKELVKWEASLTDMSVDVGALTFGSAAKQYIDVKENVLSPSTVRTYRGQLRSISPALAKTKMSDIGIADIQREVNRIALIRSPKTTSNYASFIRAVVGMFRPELHVKITLPQKEPKSDRVPTDEEVRRILEEAKGTRYEIMIVLACYGLRRSEACALTLFDFDGDVVNINKAIVKSSSKEWVTKSYGKTERSTRRVVVSKEAVMLARATAGRQNGKIWKGDPDSLEHWHSATLKKLGIEHFPYHRFRHYFVSKMHAEGVPDAVIMELGGWSSDHVLKSVYRHSMEADDMEAKRRYSNIIASAVGQ